MSLNERAHELVLPWPSRLLHPNARVHWSEKSGVAKRARSYALAVARAANWHRGVWPEGRLHVWIDGYPADHRRRDADGLLSSLKSSLDGIAEAMGVDDHVFIPHPWIKDEVRKGGEVRIRITSGP